MNLIVPSGDAEMEGERSRCENNGMGMVNSTLKKSVSITYPISSPDGLPVKMENDQRANSLTQKRLQPISSDSHSLPIPQQVSKNMKTNFDENQETNRDFSLNPKARIIGLKKGFSRRLSAFLDS